MARHDDLTSLLNRRRFSEMATICLNNLQDLQHKAAIIYVDLDDFKKVNDSFGHQAGGSLLQQVAKRTGKVK